MIVATLYFGGRDNAEMILDQFDQAAFVSNGLTNMARVVDHPVAAGRVAYGYLLPA